MDLIKQAGLHVLLSPGSSTKSTASMLGGELNTGTELSFIALFRLSSRLPTVGAAVGTPATTAAELRRLTDPSRAGSAGSVDVV